MRNSQHEHWEGCEPLPYKKPTMTMGVYSISTALTVSINQQDVESPWRVCGGFSDRVP